VGAKTSYYSFPAFTAHSRRSTLRSGGMQGAQASQLSNHRSPSDTTKLSDHGCSCFSDTLRHAQYRFGDNDPPEIGAISLDRCVPCSLENLGQSNAPLPFAFPKSIQVMIRPESKDCFVARFRCQGTCGRSETLISRVFVPTRRTSPKTPGRQWFPWKRTSALWSTKRCRPLPQMTKRCGGQGRVAQKWRQRFV
jgi:hypothetical protein